MLDLIKANIRKEEGLKLEAYKPIKSDFKLDIKEDFAYLFCGHWINGNIGEDRKNVGLLIKAFYETFKNKTKKPALILKTTSMGTSYMDRDDMLKRIDAIKKTVKIINDRLDQGLKTFADTAFKHCL